jgi:hypothetical protein
MPLLALGHKTISLIFERAESRQSFIIDELMSLIIRSVMSVMGGDDIIGI